MSMYLMKKKWKTSPASHTHVSFPHHYNRTRFYQKNMHEITILHRNFVCFSIFSEFTICQPILILQFHEKIDEQYLCKIFFKHICKITIWRWLFHQLTVGTKKWFFRPPVMSFGFLDVIFGGKGLEIDTYKPPNFIWSYHIHMVNTSCWPKWPRAPKLMF